MQKEQKNSALVPRVGKFSLQLSQKSRKNNVRTQEHTQFSQKVDNFVVSKQICGMVSAHCLAIGNIRPKFMKNLRRLYIP